MREIISLNENWTLSFPKGERPAQQVTLPHTWNAVDGMDGNGSYLRTTGVYTRHLHKAAAAPGRRPHLCGSAGSCAGGYGQGQRSGGNHP